MAASEASQIGVEHGNTAKIPHSNVVRRADPRRMHCGMHVVTYVTESTSVGKWAIVGCFVSRTI
jgi:hypothetical protein